MSGMPARWAAAGSFQVKSDPTYFTTVRVTVRALPFFLTVTLIRSVTLTVSTLGVRWYSDQRYSSMQMSVTHSRRGAIEPVNGVAPSPTGSKGAGDGTRRP